MKNWRMLAAAALLLAALVEARAALPLDAFARLPVVSDVTLSPDGERCAALMNTGDDTLLVTRGLVGEAKPKALLKTGNREFRFRWICWVNNERLVSSVAYPGRRGWVEVAQTRLLSIRRDGSGVNNLVRYKPLRQRRPQALGPGDAARPHRRGQVAHRRWRGRARTGVQAAMAAAQRSWAQPRRRSSTTA